MKNMSENRRAGNNFRLNNGTPEFGHKGDIYGGMSAPDVGMSIPIRKPSGSLRKTR